MLLISLKGESRDALYLCPWRGGGGVDGFEFSGLGWDIVFEIEISSPES